MRQKKKKPEEQKYFFFFSLSEKGQKPDFSNKTAKPLRCITIRSLSRHTFHQGELRTGGGMLTAIVRVVRQRNLH